MFENSLNNTSNENSKPIRGYFLDDERQPQDVRWKTYPNNVSWDVFSNGGDFLEALYNNGQPDIISLDYELHTIPTVNGWDGIMVLEHILDYYKKQQWTIRDTEWVVHSRAKDMDKTMHRMIRKAIRDQVNEDS